MTFQAAVPLDELPEVGAVRADVDGHPVAVVRAEDGSLHAVDDICSHAEVSLSEGDVEDCTIECWLHGSRFDLRTGAPIGLPATVPIAVYDVKIEDDMVLVDVTAPPSATTPLTAANKEH